MLCIDEQIARRKSFTYGVLLDSKDIARHRNAIHHGSSTEQLGGTETTRSSAASSLYH